MGLIQILTIICLGLFFLLGLFLLVSKTRSSLSGKLIGLFFILWGLNFLDGHLMLSGFFLAHPHLAFWEDPLVFLYGPIIYFYALSITTENFKLSVKDLLHLIPFLILFIFIFFTFHIKPCSFKLDAIHAVVDLNQPKELLFPVLVIFIHIFTYIFLAKRRIKNYREELKGFYSSFHISWLDKTLNFLIVILAISLINSFFQFAGNQYLFQGGLLVIIVLILAFVSQIYFKALEEPMLFAAGNPHKKYTTPLPEDEKEEISSRIRSLLEIDRIFLNPELTIEDVSKSLNVSSRKCSQAINEVFGQNFFDLINTYRINEAKNILEKNQDPKLTVLEVMYQVGYNSKSCFNTQFRKKTGLTPSEFKKLHP